MYWRFGLWCWVEKKFYEHALIKKRAPVGAIKQCLRSDSPTGTKFKKDIFSSGEVTVRAEWNTGSPQVHSSLPIAMN